MKRVVKKPFEYGGKKYRKGELISDRNFLNLPPSKRELIELVFNKDTTVDYGISSEINNEL